VLDLTGSPNLSGLGRCQKLIGQNGQNDVVFDRLALGCLIALPIEIGKLFGDYQMKKT
jgi:hypothetical protein